MFEAFENDNDYFYNLNYILIEENKEIFSDELNYFVDIPKEKDNSIEECPINDDAMKNNTQNEITEKSTNFEEKSKKLNNSPINQKEKLLKKKRNNSKPNIFSDDNLIRKCKKLLFENLFNFINYIIYISFKKNIGQGRFIKKLLPLNQEQKSKGNAKVSKNLINKSLKEILSENISTKFTNYSPEHNKNLVDLLTDENKTENAEYFKRLFSLKFSECLKHFNGSGNFKELEGMNTFDSLKSGIRKKEGDQYLHALNYYIINFEKHINNKRERKTKKDKLLVGKI